MSNKRHKAFFISQTNGKQIMSVIFSEREQNL